jgi:tryptophanyl-tRNA synthetase
MILKAVGVVPGTDGQKMSKSYKNTIPLFGTKDEIAKAVMSIVTDSNSDIPENVFAIHKLLKSESELASLYAEHKGKYKNLKDALTEDLEAFIAPMREKRISITDSDVKTILIDGSIRARERASKKMIDVRQKIGVSI